MYSKTDSAIESFLNQLSPYENEIIFSPQKFKLSADNYTFLLTGLLEKFARPKLKMLCLEKSDNETLKGIIQFCQEGNALPCDCLNLELGSYNPKYFKNLLNCLSGLSDKDFHELILVGEKFPQEIIEQLVQHVSENNLCINLVLPKPWQKTVFQKRLDEQYSNQLARKNGLGLAATLLAGKPKNRPTRTRPMLKQNASIDVELQQEQQAEVAIETAEESEPPDLRTPKSQKGLNFKAFSWLIEKDDFSDESKTFLLEDDLRKLWNNWLGVILEDDPSDKILISQTACQELLIYRNQFLDGIDLNNLPPGFHLKTKGMNKVLSFDKKLKAMSTYLPLQVQCTPLPEVEAISHKTFTKWLNSFDANSPKSWRLIQKQWEIINGARKYDWEEHKLFKLYLPKMLKLSAEDLELVFNLAADEDRLKAKQKFQFIFENIGEFSIGAKCRNKMRALFGGKGTPLLWMNLQKTNESPLLDLILKDHKQIKEKLEVLLVDLDVNAVLQVHELYGLTGLELLVQKAQNHPAIFKHLCKTLFSNYKTLRPLMNPAYEDALQAIEGFTPNQRLWWDSLLSQHAEAVGIDNLVDLVNAFKAFSAQLAEYTRQSGEPFVFYQPFHLQNIKSLPVALSRMLTVLALAAPDEKLQQWQCMSALDFSSTGIIKALNNATSSTRLNWHFFHPLMQITQDAYDEELKYEPSPWWKNVYVPIELGKEESGILELRKNFLRYVAFQGEEGSLPFSFYLEAQALILSCKLTAEVQSYLLSLIADSTTGIYKVASIRTSQQGLADLRKIITLLENLPMSSVIAADKFLLENLYKRLESFPPLPILAKLFELICQSLSNPLKLAMNLSKLNQACRDLIKMVNLHGEAVYQGMKDYSEENYKENDELFFNHMNDITGISELFNKDATTGSLLISLISSFQLKPEALKELPYFNPMRRPIVYALHILNLLSTLNKKPLSIEDFDFILLGITKLGDTANEKQVLNCIQGMQLANDRRLSDYFSPNFFKEYLAEEIPSDLITLITEKNIFSKEQQDQIKNLLHFFPKEPAKIIKNLIKITKPLNHIEKKLFLSALLSEDLYEEDSFLELLDVMAAKKNPDNFVFFIAESERFYKEKHKEPKELSLKAALFLGHLLPSIEMIQNLKLPKLDLMPLCTQVILETSPEELKLKFPYNDLATFDETLNFITAFSKALQEKPESPESIKPFDLKGFTRQIVLCLKKTKSKPSNISFLQLKQLAEQTQQIQARSEVNTNILTQNPKMMGLLFLYLAKKDSMDPLLKSQMEGPLENQLRQHPSIVLNQDYLPFLLQNSGFQHALSNKKVIKAVQSLSPPFDEKNLGIFFQALEEDLKATTTFENTLTEAKKNLDKIKDYWQSYPCLYADVFEEVNRLCSNNPIAKTQILKLFSTFLSHYNQDSHGPLLVYLLDFTTTLHAAFSTIPDKKSVLSLCLNFNKAKLQPEGLIRLFTTLEGLNDKDKLFLIKIATSLINEKLGYSLDNMVKLCKLVQTNDGRDELFISLLHDFYDKPPNPRLEMVFAWHDSAILIGSEFYKVAQKILRSEKSGLTREESQALKEKPERRVYEVIAEEYRQFDITPTYRESHNGFNLHEAEKKLAEFENSPLTQLDLEKIAPFIEEIRKWPTKTVLKQFKLCCQPPVQIDLLVSLAAELLYKSKGMELNTTQYMAILSMLKQGQHTTSNIATGEGKSRMTMVVLGCLARMGKTVDFLTADLQLATRDFVEFQTFFELLDVKTNMIFADTIPETYCKGGINFSDPSNLSLFRNKAKSSGQEAEIIDKNPKNRACVVDEADKTFFDMADTRFNFSTEGDNTLKGMDWIYPLLIEFFEEDPSALQLYYNDVDGCREQFMRFVKSNGNVTDLQQTKFKLLSNEQLEQWQVSAVTAIQLEYNKDFVIQADELIATGHGSKLSSEAKLRIGSRVSQSSKYSFGIHQCLHARLNRDRNQPKPHFSAAYLHALTSCKHPFFLQDEKQIVYSSTSKTLLAEYEEGLLIAVTGTAGAKLERKEASILYPYHTMPMHFIDVPRAKGLNRSETSFQLEKNIGAQREALKQQIKEAIQKNQPILVICEDDNESLELYTYLQAFFHPLLHIHSQDTLGEEKGKIKQAGHPKMITVSTDMIGRGTDIQLKGEAKKHGLHVMVTYLPATRDLEQIVGRSGRFGAPGDVHIILESERLKHQKGLTPKQSYSPRHLETDLIELQTAMDKQKQIERLVKDSVGDFKMFLTKSFFNEVFNPAKEEVQENLLKQWTKFFNYSDKAWNEIWMSLQPVLTEKPFKRLQIRTIENYLIQYQQELQNLWSTLLTGIQKDTIQDNYGKLPEQLPLLTLDKNCYDILGFKYQKNLLTQLDEKIINLLNTEQLILLYNLFDSFYPHLMITPYLDKTGHPVFEYKIYYAKPYPEPLHSVLEAYFAADLQYDAHSEAVYFTKDFNQLFDLEKQVEFLKPLEKRVQNLEYHLVTKRLPFMAKIVDREVENNAAILKLTIIAKHVGQAGFIELKLEIPTHNLYTMDIAEIDQFLIHQLDAIKINSKDYFQKQFIERFILKLTNINIRLDKFFNIISQQGFLSRKYSSSEFKDLKSALKLCKTEEAVLLVTKKFIDERLDTKRSEKSATVSLLLECGLIEQHWVLPVVGQPEHYLKAPSLSSEESSEEFSEKRRDFF